MPNSNQAKKRLRQNAKSKLRNQGMKSAMKTQIKRVLKAVDDQDLETAKTVLPLAMKKIDKAAKKNVIHKNQASRKVARLSRKVSGLEKNKA